MILNLEQLTSSRDVLIGHMSAGVQQVAVFIRQHLRQNLSAVVPFVNQLVQNPGVGVLRDETGSEQLDAHSLDLFDQAGIVEEPPAAENHEVAEFSGGNA